MTQSTTKTHKKTLGATALVLIALLFLGVTILTTFALRGVRLDLTESKLYSISPGTQSILDKLDEPINLYFFFSQDASKDSPSLRAYAQRVRELLEELAQRSDGKLRLTILNPEPFSEEEDRAAEFGLSAAPITAGGETIYFGLAGTNSVDGREVIPLFQPQKEEFLEYEVASLIHRLGNPDRPVVGLLTSLPVDARFDPQTGRMAPGWAIVSQLRQMFEVQPLTPDAGAIDSKITTLLLIHPKDLSERTLYAIDQFVLRGGKLIAFIDPQSEEDQPMPMGQMPSMGSRSSTLGPLLTAWGVEYDENKVLGDRELGLVVSLRQGEAPSQHVAIVGLNRESMNDSDIVVSELDSINVMTSGVLIPTKDSKLTFEPLLQSSKDSMLFPVERMGMLEDSRSLLNGFRPSGERYAIAARVHGKFASAFPEGVAAGEGTQPVTHLKESQTESHVILVADTDVLADPLWVRAQEVFGQRFFVAWANNGDFVANALDNLAGSADLISIRGRQSFFRPFDRVEALRRQADEQLRAKEQELDAELRETERKVSELEASRGAQGSLVMSPEQEAELNRFQQQRVRIRKELRDVQRSLDLEIERLGSVLKFLNIALVPALIACAAIGIAVARRRRLRAGRAQATRFV